MKKVVLICLMAAFAASLLAGCNPYRKELSQNPLETGPQKGYACYYGKEYNGRQTASGETFKNSEMTAAHRTLPFGVKVKVTNLKNNKSVVVRINDRGPFDRDRIIDLSYAAAVALDMVKDGVVPVVVEVVSKP